jgi:D-alanine--poly(phosphoribitol) ligase subunit 1
MSQSLLNKNESIAQRAAAVALKYPGNYALYIDQRYYTYKVFFNIVHAIYNKIPGGKLYNRIGIWCNDDVYSYAAILAVNLYGAAYVPLNKKYPSARNQRIILESKPDLIMSSYITEEITSLSAELPLMLTADAVDLTASMNSLKRKPEQDICYILFTSGSTGEPKGVPVTNSNVNAFFDHFLKNYDFQPEDRFLQTYELTFDVSVFSVFMPLLAGACCYILPDEGIRPVKIVECLQKYKITVLSMVPGVLKYLDSYLDEIKLPDLRYSFFSGDALYHHLAVRWSHCMPNGKVHNFYGPTETTIVCTSYVFEEKRSGMESVNGIVPVGKPFEGMEFIITDEKHKKTEKGELCFTGTQVIPAYLNNANEEKFFMHDSKRYYSTGDIVSLNEHGNLVFHGRSDSQVKINGYRVELMEVEKALRNVSGLNCLILCVEEAGINRLYAFLETGSTDEQLLKQKLADSLPYYMIPHRLISVERFPLNTNGKTDRKALINTYI